MTDEIAPEFRRFITAERRADRLPAALRSKLSEGEVSHHVIIGDSAATELLRVTARRASGLLRPSKRKEIVWVSGDSELAIIVAELSLRFEEGIMHMLIPVLSDQTGSDQVEVVFAIGSPGQPAGLFSSTFRRPNGPELIVNVWGDALVAFAWQCVIGIVSGIAGATGKDTRGNTLVPVEMSASAKGLRIVPMARHRISGTSVLKKREVAP